MKSVGMRQQTEIRFYTPVELLVNHEYQRDLRRSWVDKIKARFDPRLLGTFTVAIVSGKPYLVDGQHRAAAMIELGEPWASFRVPCVTFLASTVQEAAFVFEGLQRTLRMRMYDRFKATLLSGDSEASEIADIVQSCGCHLSLAMGSASATCAISALLDVYHGAGFGLVNGTFPELLRRTISTIRAAFPDDHALTQAAILGVGRFLYRYWDVTAFSRNRLSDQLGRRYGDYGKFYAAAKSNVPRPYSHIRDAVPHICVITYNVGLRTKHLAPWS